MVDELVVGHEAADVPKLRGGFDFPKARAFEDRVRDAQRNGSKFIILDCKDLEYISSPIGSLVFCRGDLVENGGDLLLAGLNAKVKVVLSLMKLDAFFPTYETVAEALKHLRSRNEAC